MATTSAEAGPSSGLAYEERNRLENQLPAVSWDVVAVPAGLTALGVMLGLLRGSRMAGLQFAAENAHRAPKTMDGWYFYQKTKNYRVILGGLKAGALRGLQLGGVGTTYVGLREAGRYVGMQEWSECLAGLGTGGVIGAVYRPPRRQFIQLLALGAGFGLTTALLRRAQAWGKKRRAELEGGA
ncbi:hypothetical protein CALCODRAFT_489493 [Calocera cornea HHB12733]|uniref:Uncharacterized protein n=1 Tax=Calocera cornea HHB12733 TaxID=1353952 RepID=A0A165KC81_9BASI|nr:hypothetical protein CALCODRAFT_489493 [Calocera cornea HHB12733]